MLNLKLSTKIIIAAAFLCFILFLVFVSVLGINNNAQSDVKHFFQQVSSRDYAGALKLYSEKARTKQASFQETIRFHFTLELALLEHFGLMDNPRYSIKIKRDNMWLPFLTPNELKVSVNFTPQQDTNLIAEYLSKAGPDALNGFITMRRENEKWKISQINIEGSKLENVFKRIYPQVTAGKYVSVTPENIELKAAHLELKKLDPLERKILTRDLQTALEVLDKEGTAPDQKIKLPF